MIVFSLIVSSILIFVAICAVRYWQAPLLIFGGTYLLLAFGPLCIMMGLEPVMLQGLLLFIAVALCCYPKRHPRAIVGISFALTAVAYVVIGAFAWQEVADALAKYPFQSLERRLPAPVASPSNALPQSALDEIALLEETNSLRYFVHERRLRALEQLHESTFQAFISNPGFGAARMDQPSIWMLNQINEGKIVEQPTKPSRNYLSAANKDGESLTTAKQPIPTFAPMHRGSTLDFTRPQGFGFFKDRQHVAGFLPHRFRELPKAPPPHAVDTVELIGLVVHPSPVVYVSDHLPRMEELASAPKRTPDAFETPGLKELQDGGDLFVRETPTQTRVLGSVRALKQCTECHACERGRLLGAFSYRLAKANEP